jgi:hypothetical protein
MKRRLDQHSQRQLLYELRHAIDRAMRRPSDTQAIARVQQLLAENPRSASSSHVTHNLGIARRAWLAHLPSSPEGRSLGRFSTEKHE